MNLWPTQVPIAAHAWLPLGVAASVPLALLLLIPLLRRRARALATVIALRTVGMLGVGFALLVAVTALSIVHTGLIELRERHENSIRALTHDLATVPATMLPVEAQLRSTLFAAKAEKIAFIATGDARACAKLCVLGGVDKSLSAVEVKRRLIANWPTASGEEYTVSIAGRPFLLIAEPIFDGATPRAMVIAGIDATYLVQQATTTAWILLAIGYGIVALVGWSSWRHLNASVGARIHAITKQVKNGIADEDPTANLQLHADELRELADSVSHYIRTTIEAQKVSDERYRRLVELAPDGVIMCTKSNIKFANTAAIQLAGVKSRYDIIGSPIAQFLEFEIRNSEQPVGVPRAGRWKRKDGTVLEVQVAEIGDASDGSAQYVVRDVTEIKNREAALAHRADHDWLTGLVNRARFEAKLHEMLAPAGAVSGRLGAARQIAVFFIDLDGFKPVNDRYGHAAGDAVLVAVADRLKDSTRGSDLVARLGGDEFAILLEVRDHDEVTRVADRILSSLKHPIEFEGNQLQIGASIGVSDTHVGGDSPALTAAELLHAADLAMYAVKQKSKAARAA